MKEKWTICLFDIGNKEHLHNLSLCGLHGGRIHIIWSSKCTGPAALVSSRSVLSIYLHTSPPNCSRVYLSIILQPPDILPKHQSLASLALRVPCYSLYVYFVVTCNKIDALHRYMYVLQFTYILHTRLQ